MMEMKISKKGEDGKRLVTFTFLNGSKINRRLTQEGVELEKSNAKISGFLCGKIIEED